ncbi:hypothetical protein DL89DRAFT_268450 [Linderina pennispora]|uniref:Uncharacterized protein n=1 Tax=Linderina pennispora TaxID=61395 RepID=A0A1Y1W679_9FUNG|nr:uncharacterized protein DL89DRAFT_268450 [Linderina pennispora]ORX68664.1 hypothetical protein DL89DRAFT_268450 [Linderina pennispora]
MGIILRMSTQLIVLHSCGHVYASRNLNACSSCCLVFPLTIGPANATERRFPYLVCVAVALSLNPSADRIHPVAPDETHHALQIIDLFTEAPTTLSKPL